VQAFNCLNLCLSALLTARAAVASEIRVPAFTAYLEPRSAGARVSEKGGVVDWNDPSVKVCWYGKLSQGALEASVTLHLAAGTSSKLRFSVAGRSSEQEVTSKGTEVVVADFGTFEVPSEGYQRFTLESLDPVGQHAGDVESLSLKGTAIESAHFNLKPRRNAASVHLMYPVTGYTNVEAFYCEVTALEDPLWTFYMACGWHRGYFGMQVNSPTERRIIFSVWDSGSEAVDRRKVGEEDRVSLVAKGPGVYSGDFGNEGTGGHSHLKYLWKTGEKQRFIVTARPTDPTHTIFSGFYYHPEDKKWMLISSWKAPKEGGYLRGLHSFSENFWGENGQLVRKALYGNQWIRLSTGDWVELTKAKFSHDPTGKADRLDRFMGVEQGQFFLSHGGFIPGFTSYGEVFSRPASLLKPADLELPSIPQ